MEKHLNTKKRRPKEMEINQAHKKVFHNSFEFRNQVNSQYSHSVMGNTLMTRSGRPINMEINCFEKEKHTLMENKFFHCNFFGLGYQ
jgi:hypothetical protein